MHGLWVAGRFRARREAARYSGVFALVCALAIPQAVTGTGAVKQLSAKGVAGMTVTASSAAGSPGDIPPPGTSSGGPNTPAADSTL